MGAPQSDPDGREQDTGRLQGLQGVLRGRRNADGRGGPPAPVPAAKPTVACATPAENYAYHSNAAADKYAYPYPKLAVLGVLAGASVGRLEDRNPTRTGRGSAALVAQPTLLCMHKRSSDALPAGAYIGLGYSLCCLCAGLLSPDFRKQQPGAFNLLFGIYGGWRMQRLRLRLRLFLAIRHLQDLKRCQSGTRIYDQLLVLCQPRHNSGASPAAGRPPVQVPPWASPSAWWRGLTFTPRIACTPPLRSMKVSEHRFRAWPYDPVPHATLQPLPCSQAYLIAMHAPCNALAGCLLLGACHLSPVR